MTGEKTQEVSEVRSIRLDRERGGAALMFQPLQEALPGRLPGHEHGSGLPTKRGADRAAKKRKRPSALRGIQP